MRCALPLAFSALAACSSVGGPYPSLAPRAAETVDPRVPVVRPINDRPAGAALASRLAGLVGNARSAEGDFDRLASQAEALAAKSGGRQSEGWIAAQEALTAAIAARQPVTTALGDIDALGANALQTQGGIAPNDLAAIREAAATVSEIDQRQAARLNAIKTRLGS